MQIYKRPERFTETPVESHPCPGIAKEFHFVDLFCSIGKGFLEWKERVLRSASNVCSGKTVYLGLVTPSDPGLSGVCCSSQPVTCSNPNLRCAVPLNP